MYQRETAFTTTIQNPDRTFVLRNTGVIRYYPKTRAGLAVVTVDGPQIGDATSGNVTRSKRGYAIAESAVNSDRPVSVDERTLKDALDAFVSAVAQRVAHPVRKARTVIPTGWELARIGAEGGKDHGGYGAIATVFPVVEPRPRGWKVVQGSSLRTGLPPYWMHSTWGEACDAAVADAVRQIEEIQNG